MTLPRYWRSARSLGEPGFVADGEDAAEEVGVAADVFGAAVQDDVGAVEEGVLQRGWGEGRVDEEVGGAAVCEGGVVGYVEGGAVGVDGGFEDD